MSISSLRPYRILEHTADIGLAMEGGSLAELFANAAQGFFSLLTPLEEIRPLQQVELAAQGLDQEELLVAWLGELLYYFEAEGWLFCQVEILTLTDQTMTALATGEPFDHTRHVIETAIKAVTYHNLAITQRDNGSWQAQVFFDL